MKLKESVKQMRATLRRLHENEKGADDILVKILVLAFIALPLLGLLMHYREEVKKYLADAFKNSTKGGTSVTP